MACQKDENKQKRGLDRPIFRYKNLRDMWANKGIAHVGAPPQEYFKFWCSVTISKDSLRCDGIFLVIFVSSKHFVRQRGWNFSRLKMLSLHYWFYLLGRCHTYYPYIGTSLPNNTTIPIPRRINGSYTFRVHIPCTYEPRFLYVPYKHDSKSTFSKITF